MSDDTQHDKVDQITELKTELAEATQILEDFTYAFEVCMQGAERTRPLPNLDLTIARARAAIGRLSRHKWSERWGEDRS